MPTEFDVFLSHNSDDKDAVREVAEALTQRGVTSWLDEKELLPGRPWHDALQAVIQTARAAAVFIGPNGLGPWERPEMNALLSEFVERKIPLIPILLPGAPKDPNLPIFLKSFTWVDLRDGMDGAKLDHLARAILHGQQSDGDTIEAALDSFRRETALALEEIQRQVRGRADETESVSTKGVGLEASQSNALLLLAAVGILPIIGICKLFLEAVSGVDFFQSSGGLYVGVLVVGPLALAFQMFLLSSCFRAVNLKQELAFGIPTIPAMRASVAGLVLLIVEYMLAYIHAIDAW